jgi:hypothetical protein
MAPLVALAGQVTVFLGIEKRKIRTEGDSKTPDSEKEEK